jgi:hypothetical protein
LLSQLALPPGEIEEGKRKYVGQPLLDLLVTRVTIENDPLAIYHRQIVYLRRLCVNAVWNLVIFFRQLPRTIL